MADRDRMDRAELDRQLGGFETELEAADLRPSAVKSYVDYASRFVRWLSGDYRPRNAGPLSWREDDRRSARSWTTAQLEAELPAYRAVLVDARLRPSAIATYIQGADVFVRWLAGQYRPLRSPPTDTLGIRPNDLARELGIPGLALRNYLRARYPRSEEQRGAAWYLSREQVDDVRAYFDHKSARGAPPATVRPPQASAVPDDWFWEGRVQDAVVRHLLNDGWHIEQMANTAIRAQGHDIVASRDGRRLVVEVKGYPSVGYRDPRRAGEVKRTQPTGQAKHWYAEALLKAIRIGGHGRVGVVLAFPDFPRYRSLLTETNHALKALGIGVLVIHESGAIDEVAPPVWVD